MQTETFIGVAAKVRRAITTSNLPAAVQTAAATAIDGAKDDEPVFVSVATTPAKDDGEHYFRVTANAAESTAAKPAEAPAESTAAKPAEAPAESTAAKPAEAPAEAEQS